MQKAKIRVSNRDRDVPPYGHNRMSTRTHRTRVSNLDSYRPPVDQFLHVYMYHGIYVLISLNTTEDQYTGSRSRLLYMPSKGRPILFGPGKAQVHRINNLHLDTQYNQVQASRHTEG